MLRTIAIQRLAGLAAATLFSVFLTGCVDDTPRTQLDWYPKGDEHVRHYTYNDDRPTPPPPHVVHKKKPAPVQMAALDCPPGKAKPDGNRPGWYTQNTPPPPSAPVSQPATYAPVTGGLIFASPVNGPVVADYGTTVSGERNVGINIAAPFGTPIHAAAAGQVSYAGNELRGYGNLEIGRAHV